MVRVYFMSTPKNGGNDLFKHGDSVTKSYEKSIKKCLTS